MSEPSDSSGVAGRLPSTGGGVGRVPSHGVPNATDEPPRRLRRLHRVWPDRDGNISYLLTICVDGRTRVLDNQDTFQRLVAFLLDSPERYHWYGRRFVLMPDHVHLIARMGHDAVRLGQWIKALKAVVGGLFHNDVGGPRLVPGKPPLLETGILIDEDGTPRGGTRPTT